MHRSDPTLKKWYRLYNEQHFHNKLPRNTIVRWGTEEEWEEEDIRLIADTDVANRPMEIRISPWLKRLKWYGIARFTLYHEMCHVKLEHTGTPQEDDHDRAFEREMLRLAQRGAFSKRPGQSCLW